MTRTLPQGAPSPRDNTRRDLNAGAAEAFTVSADYEGADHASRRREHARGTSQLTDLRPNAQACALRAPELAASGCGQRAQRSSGTGPPSREALRRGLAVALAEAEIGGARRERLRRAGHTARLRVAQCASTRSARLDHGINTTTARGASAHYDRRHAVSPKCSGRSLHGVRWQRVVGTGPWLRRATGRRRSRAADDGSAWSRVAYRGRRQP